jgi:putative autoinducer-2 (AI-2) aldolase
MAEADATSSSPKDFRPEVPQRSETFFLKGSNELDWGMKNRLSRIFDPASGRTVMLAVDHGYFQGPTTGLERVDLDIVPLLPWADTLMCTRGILRTSIPPTYRGGIVLRASGGPSILARDLSEEEIALSMEEAVRLDAAAVAVQVFIGGEGERKSVHNMTRLVDQGNRYGVATLAVTAVGRELTRDARYMRLATRICAELGATYVKTYYVEDGFDTVAAACPVPLVIAGGKKLPEKDALRMAHRAVQDGAAGVDMGRNIFQSEDPAAMIQAVRRVVHDGTAPEEAYELFRELAHHGAPAGVR